MSTGWEPNRDNKQANTRPTVARLEMCKMRMARNRVMGISTKVMTQLAGRSEQGGDSRS
jgi:hypothetical protein